MSFNWASFTVRAYVHFIQRIIFTLCFSALIVFPVSGLASSHAHQTEADPNQAVLDSLFPTNDLWKVLRRDMNLDHQADRPEVKAQIQWFLKHPKFISLIANNAKPYLYYVLLQIRQHKLPTELVLLPIIESGYDPFAYSPAGAAGLWQMMPGTASGFGLKQTWWYDGRRDVVASTKAALDYLAYLDNFFNGNWELAIAAYDSGEGSVLTAIRRNVAKGASTDFWSLHLPQETRAYIPKVLALAEIISHPNKYSIDLPPIPNKPYMTVVDVGTQIDLKTAASLSGMSLESFLKLNPGFNRWATSPDGPFELVLPIEKVQQFQAKLAKLPDSKRVTWKRYTVARGDSLGKLAEKFHTTVALLTQINKLSSSEIHVGQLLFIPMSTNRLPSQVIRSAQKYLDVEQQHLAGPQQIVYTVQGNDSLWKIAKRFHVRASAIQFWNGMKRDSVLKPGLKIVMWVKPSKKDRNPLKVQEVAYTVKSGDTLGKIAAKFNTTSETLLQLNHLSSSSISPGQSLLVYKNLLVRYDDDKLMVTYEVESGDSLGSIAKQFDTSTAVIKQLNGLNSARLKIGESLMIVPHALPSINNPHLHKQTPPQKMLYLVQPNDSLILIAKKFNVTVDQIRGWNVTAPDSTMTLQAYELITIYI
jgi:membrane-bound lytic murein transglycosylase D